MKATRSAAILCVLIASACRLSEEAPAGEQPESAARPEAGERTRPEAPAGFAEMTVADVVPEGDSHVVLLADADKKLFLPIVVGGTEALAIHLRSGRRPPQRPRPRAESLCGGRRAR